MLLEDKYKAKLHLLCKTKLNSKHLVQAINTYALPSLLYGAAVLNWSDLELKTLDIKTRKILRTYNILGINNSVERLYIKRDFGGKGLINIYEKVRQMEKNTLNNILRQKTKGNLLQIVNTDMTIFIKYSNTLKVLKSKPLHGKFFLNPDMSKKHISGRKTIK